MASSNLRNNPQSEPLTPAKLPNSQSASEPLIATAFYTIKAFGYARIVLGAASLFSPHFTCGLFKLAISNETATIVRLFGVRGVALGELLVTADDASLPDGGRRELRRLLRANTGCDLVDICSLAVAVAIGHMGQLPGALLAGGAAVCAGMGVLGLKTL
ncbi:hypothetical protein BDV95DRAFT_600171 [Massariosphaeria phaeospora]|uniref:Uncharacterized protein n=1 Tax=Massariosphaeria phaeospora TaxID=100035 RepID=A0A7C8I2B9_9PLEO|nr:hypothetical protein BDV95DRAFT_600171 [Massariosphaeria phaeospora]